MVDSSDVEGLVKQLRDLQLEQAEVIRRIEVAVKSKAHTNTEKLSPGDRVQILTKVKPIRGVAPTKLDRVGQVLSITPKRVKAKTDSGVTTLRAPHNLKKLEIEEHA